MDAIKKLIQEGNYDAAFEQMNSYVDEAHEDEWIQLCGRYNNLKKLSTIGSLLQNEELNEQNKIIAAFLNFIDRVESKSPVLAYNETTHPQKPKKRSPVAVIVAIIVLVGLGMTFLLFKNSAKKGYFDYESYNIPANINYILDTLKENNYNVKDIAFDNNLSWVILKDRNNAIWSGNLPPYLVDKIEELHSHNDEIKQVAFGPDSRWIILFNKNEYWIYPDVQDSLRVHLNKYYASNNSVKHLSFGPNAGEWAMLINYNGYDCWNVPSILLDKLKALSSSPNNVEIKSLVITNKNEWIILINKNEVLHSANIDPILNATFEKLKKKDVTIRSVCLLKNGGWVVLTE